MPDSPVTRRPVLRFEQGRLRSVDDALAVEGPLEIRIGGQTLSVTLRTPGHDRELAVGFLASEGLIARREHVASVSLIAASCRDQADGVDVTLAPGVVVDWSRFERHFAATAACGLCGRAHLESLRAGLAPVPVGARFDPAALGALPGRLRETQTAFTATGGLHAAAYCDASLAPQVLREDVGRHNAVDKVVGWLLDRGQFPVEQGMMWVSGRAGAELVLKAARARIPLLAAVGAPSSLAVELAEAAAMTLVGFLREGRLNVYCGAERLAG
jgi:FdhD protein